MSCSREENVLGKRKTKPGHNPFLNIKSLGTNRITIQREAHPWKIHFCSKWFWFNQVLIMNSSWGSHQNCLPILYNWVMWGKNNNFIFWLFLSSIFISFQYWYNVPAIMLAFLPNLTNWFALMCERCLSLLWVMDVFLWTRGFLLLCGKIDGKPLCTAHTMHSKCLTQSGRSRRSHSWFC